MGNLDKFLNKIIEGNCLDVMKEIPDESIDMVMYSPPYYKLRHYSKNIQIEYPTGYKGELGQEPTVDLYVEHLALINKEIYRILKKTGSLYINIGDIYIDKCLQGIPWRLAFRLMNDKWILRNCIIWYKPNAAPQSVKDRLTNTYEYIFHLVKSHKYYYDLDAIREPYKESTITRAQYPDKGEKCEDTGYAGLTNIRKGEWHNKLLRKLGKIKEVKYRTLDNVIKTETQIREEQMKELAKERGYSEHSSSRLLTGLDVKSKMGIDISHPIGRNPGDLFIIPTATAFKDIKAREHYAIYPEELCRKPILSSSPYNGIVIDPLCGTGTTCKVAAELGRNFIGIELNPKYVKIARNRVAPYVNKLDRYSKNII